MPTLPPYSTFRTDSKQMLFPQATSHGNILTFTPPGFTQSLNVKFPDSRLAVCEKCKKNFKTRDMCRVRNVHTTAPWSTAYICITVDESCTGPDGKYVDKPLTVRMVQWQPFCTKKPFDPKTPVCSACKRTNRTRSFCRERHKHRHMPWCTVYVILSALDSTDPTTVVAGASQKVEGEEDEENREEPPNCGKLKAVKGSSTTEEVSEAGSDTIGSEVDEESDDINDIAESRTFLAKVSVRGSSIHWLDLGEYDSSADPTFVPPPNPTASDSAPAAAPAPSQQQQPQQQQQQQPQYGTVGIPVPPADYHSAYAMGYAAQQHQNALKSHQQYFFQMQQRQQQQYQQQQQQPPPPQWQQYNMGQQQQQQGDTSQVGATAGDGAVASQQKRGGNTTASPADDSYQALQQQQWALYYGQAGFGQDGTAATAAAGPGGPEMPHPDQYQGEGSSEDPADDDDGEAKRQRVS